MILDARLVFLLVSLEVTNPRTNGSVASTPTEGLGDDGSTFIWCPASSAATPTLVGNNGKKKRQARAFGDPCRSWATGYSS